MLMMKTRRFLVNNTVHFTEEKKNQTMMQKQTKKTRVISDARHQMSACVYTENGQHIFMPIDYAIRVFPLY